MQHIDAASLEDLPARIAYLSSFLNLTPEDGVALSAVKPVIGGLVPAILDAVYTKLLSFDITAQVFVPQSTGYEGKTVASVKELTLESDVIKFRKDFLQNYLVKLVSNSDLSPTSPFWVYLNNVGIMHTGLPGFKHRAKRPELRVEYIHMGALLGFVVDLVLGAVMVMDELENVTKAAAIRALNKVIWIQNDLFARHYIKDIGMGGEKKPTIPVDQAGEEKNGGCPFAH